MFCALFLIFVQVIHAKLENVGAQLVVEGKDSYDTIWPTSRPISTESLIIGALEAAFWEADHIIGEEKKVYSMPGGCTVLVALFILGKPSSFISLFNTAPTFTFYILQILCNGF